MPKVWIISEHGDGAPRTTVHFDPARFRDHILRLEELKIKLEAEQPGTGSWASYTAYRGIVAEIR